MRDGRHLKQSSARKKTHCVVFALEGTGKLPATEAIKDGNEQAKATDGNEVPLWNTCMVFRN